MNNFSMGGVNRYMFDNYIINPYNPATYSHLEATTFDMGLNYVRYNTEGANASQTTDNAGLRYFGLGFPIADRWGWAMGMVPHTEVGYEFTRVAQVDGMNSTSTYSGDGGLNKVFGGLGFEAIKDTNTTLSFGANFLYFFGPTQSTTRVTYDDGGAGTYSSVIEEGLNASDVNFDLGVHFRQDLTNALTKKRSKRLYFNFGASGMMPTTLKTRRRTEAYSSFSTPKDYVRDQEDTIGMTLPFEAGGGFSLEFVDINKKSRFILGANFEYANWSEFAVDDRNAGLNDSYTASIGMQYNPNERAIRGLLEIMRYRAGLRYTSTHINIDSESVTDYGMSFGLSIPLIASKSVTSTSTTINLGAEFGIRGDNAVISEQYSKFIFGVSLTPSFWDEWFKRKKID